MEIGGLQKFTLVDYPGIVACTVFLIGCNFRCPWCYSSELVLPDKITRQPRIRKIDFFDFLCERKKVLEGVVVCGGEPTVNPELPEFISEIKEKGFKVKLDTNGSNPEELKKLMDKSLIDYVAMDIKAPKNKYAKAIGREIDIKKIEKSINLLKKGDVDYEFRSTILPEIHRKKDVIDMAKWIKGARAYYLQKFRPEKTLDPSYQEKISFGENELNLIREECNKYLPTELRI